MKITPFFLWRDFWIGLFWDDQKRILYICPIPMFGIKIGFDNPVEVVEPLAYHAFKGRTVDLTELNRRLLLGDKDEPC